MEALLARELVVDIDNRVEQLILEINSAPSGQAVDFASDLQGVVVDAILGPFGLSRAMFADKDGGQVTTVRNFENGITATAEDAARHTAYGKARDETFDRSDYEASLPRERKAIFRADDSVAVQDAYTGKPLPKDGRAHRDHVVSAHEIERSAKGQLAQTREERVATANLDDNKVWTHQSINSSKGDKDLMEWSLSTRRDVPTVTNGEHFGVDFSRAEEVHHTARKAVDRTQNLAVAKKQAAELLKTGSREAGTLALRQVIGLVLKDVAEGLIEDIKALVREGFRSVAHLVDTLNERLQRTVTQVQERWREYLKEGLAAGLTGFLSSLTTLVVNSLVTTAKRVVTIIREGILAIARSIKMIVAPPEGMSAKQVALEVLKLLSGALVTSLGLMMQEGIAKMLESVPLLAPVAQELSAVVTTILSGTAGLLTVLAFDHVRAALAFRNKELADRHREHATTLLKMQRGWVMIQAAKDHVHDSSAAFRHQLERDWLELDHCGAAADQSLDDYSASIDSLTDMLGRL